MSGTITRIGLATAGALLTVGLLTASPAAAKPSERGDKGGRPQSAACFDETGKTQGKSHSDPDGMKNGGYDKPGCTGGFDSDRDGNNGCGNDADREDDNNGHCGRRGDKDRDDDDGENGSSTTTTSTTATTTTAGGTDDGEIEAADAGTSTTAGTTTDVLAETAVTGDSVTAGPATAAPGTAAAAEPVTTEVLGETLERPSTLPRTGAGLAGLALLGGLLCGSGRILSLARRFKRIG
jgi:hypothetical protein